MGQLLRFSLEDHLNECEARYQGLTDKIDQIDLRLNRMEELLLEIKQSIRPRSNARTQ